MSSIQMIAAALAAALMVPAAAQSDQGAEKWRKGRAAATQPAPGQAQATGQPQALATQEQQAAFGAVHAHNQLAAQIGDMAASRGASEQVKELGRSVAQDHRRIDGEFATLLKARGLDLNTLPPGAERSRLEGEIGQLGGKSGDELDRGFVSFLTRNGVAFVDALKRARDVVPGKDGQLKKFLDDAENAEEGHLAAARQAKSQRQARTPPAR
jgi:putative membrane protein